MRKILLIALAGVCLGCTLVVEADTVKGSFTKSLQVDGPIALEVKARSGSVEIVGAEGDTVRVEGRIRSGWKIGIDEAERRVREIERNPPVDVRDGVVMIGEMVSPAMLEDVSVSYVISIPARAKVTAESSSGSLSVEDVVGTGRSEGALGRCERAPGGARRRGRRQLGIAGGRRRGRLAAGDEPVRVADVSADRGQC